MVMMDLLRKPPKSRKHLPNGYKSDSQGKTCSHSGFKVEPIVMKKIYDCHIFISTLTVTILFAIFLLLSKPILNYDDDFYALYTLSGGYGNEPTNILHYYYGWNPFLFWPIAKLFTLFPNFNWYTFFLLVLQLISCINLLYLFSFMFKRLVAIVLFILFFLFFETLFLQSLNYTNTSFVLAISGFSSLSFYFLNTWGKTHLFQKRRLIVPCLLLLLSGLLRIHALALYALLSIAMSFLIMTFYNFKKFIVLLSFLAIILLAFVLAHNYYYKIKIPNIEQEEKFRQSFFYLANHPSISETRDTGMFRVKNSFIQSCFLYDTSFTSDKDLKTLSQKKIQNRIGPGKEISFILYWLFRLTRVYLFLFATILFVFISFGASTHLQKWLGMFLLGLLTLAVLLLFFKLTAGILVTIACSIFMAGIFLLRNGVIHSRISPFFPLLFLLSSAWMIIIIKKLNDACIKNIEITRGILTELNAHKTSLFLHTSAFNDNGFYIWDTPKQYPVTNLINKELVLTDSYLPILQRFHIKDLMASLPERADVFVAGPNLPLLKDYYLLAKGLKVNVVKAEGFKYLLVYKVKKTNP
jgi:hypothetical protein